MKPALKSVVRLDAVQRNGVVERDRRQLYLDAKEVGMGNGVRRPLVRSKDMPDMSEFEPHP